MKKYILTFTTIVWVLVPLWGCTTLNDAFIQEKPPSIAHAHIGHATTGWRYTPDQKGLYQVAEEETKIARDHAGYAVERLDNIDLIKLHVGHVMHALNPESQKEGPGLGFGAKKALTEAASHITYAAGSEDASENVRNFAEPFNRNAEAIVQRYDLILALGEEILQTSSNQDAAALAGEILILSRANVEGTDSDGNNAIGPAADEYGLKQLRAQITDMINRENPPYRPVPQRYLFGLIRLPSGKWAYSSSITGSMDPAEEDEEQGGY